ncbi:CIC11C00000001871 [Sungouiella intermedia]|uniref:CIC11C00000001871 n=1 Tax=Sungouiella intermedia TaxID=45354 RepID=A0A1L0D7F9_9ASCO|nr:CIC11C00000001871 [[Candida] intermedia]
MASLTRLSTPIALTLRGLQVLVSLLLIILASVNLSITGYSEVRRSVISGSITLVYYLLTITPFTRWYPPFTIFCWELATLALYSVAVPFASVLYRDTECTSGYGSDMTECRTGVGSFVLGCIGLVLAFISFVLVITYSFVPACKQKQVFSCNHFRIGAIFPKQPVKKEDCEHKTDDPLADVNA